MFLGTKCSHFGRSHIERSTIEAYLETDYRIEGDQPLVLRIGKFSAGLSALYKERGRACAGVLTAWNPYSEPRSDTVNHAAQERLIRELDRRGLSHQPGVGADPTGNWPPEDSRLILGIDIWAARSLGRRFHQNGFVWAAADAEPALVLLY
jgi:hypothetical protein